MKPLHLEMNVPISNSDLNKLIDKLENLNINPARITFAQWSLICSRQPISIKFMRGFKKFIQWDLISAYQNIDDEFASEFKDKLNWNTVCRHRSFTLDFLFKYVDYIDLEIVFLRRQFLPDGTYNLLTEDMKNQLTVLRRIVGERND